MGVITAMHILSRVDDVIEVASYFNVPLDIYDVNSVDPSRTASSALLTSGELQELKDGYIFENVTQHDIVGKDADDIYELLIDAYTDYEQDTLDNAYSSAYTDYVGKSYSGGTWS